MSFYYDSETAIHDPIQQARKLGTRSVQAALAFKRYSIDFTACEAFRGERVWAPETDRPPGGGPEISVLETYALKRLSIDLSFDTILH